MTLTTPTHLWAFDGWKTSECSSQLKAAFRSRNGAPTKEEEWFLPVPTKAVLHPFKAAAMCSHPDHDVNNGRYQASIHYTLNMVTVSSSDVGDHPHYILWKEKEREKWGKRVLLSTSQQATLGSYKTGVLETTHCSNIVVHMNPSRVGRGVPHFRGFDCTQT